MPNPTRISLPRVNYNFDAKACVPVLTVMLNKVEKDYSTVDELCDHDELSKFTDRNSYFSFGQTAEQRTPWLETAEGFFAFVKKERRAGAQKSMDG